MDLVKIVKRERDTKKDSTNKNEYPIHLRYAISKMDSCVNTKYKEQIQKQ